MIALRDAGYTITDPELQTAIDEAAARFSDMREHIDTLQSTIYEERAANFGPSVVSETEGLRSTLIILVVIAAILSLGAIYWLIRQISPLRKVTAAARALALGDTTQEITHTSRDETGDLAETFRSITEYFREASDVAERIADGDLTATITPRSEQDQLSTSLAKMITGLREVVTGAADVTKQVGDGSEVLAASSEESARAAAEVATSINSVADGATDQAMIAEQLAAAVRDIVTELEATTRAFEDVSAASTKPTAAPATVSPR